MLGVLGLSLGLWSLGLPPFSVFIALNWWTFIFEAMIASLMFFWYYLTESPSINRTAALLSMVPFSFYSIRGLKMVISWSFSSIMEWTLSLSCCQDTLLVFSMCEIAVDRLILLSSILSEPFLIVESPVAHGVCESSSVICISMLPLFILTVC